MVYDFLDAKSVPISGVSFWQTPTWQSILLSSHQAREVFYYGNNSGTWMLVEIRSIGLGQYGAFSIGISENQAGDDFLEFFFSIQKILQGKGALFFQIEPIEEIQDSKFIGEYPVDKIQDSKFYKAFLTPHTRVLDLTLSEEDILKQMHEKGRYNIRLAEKRGVTVKLEDSSKENIDIWMSLLSETTSRDGFSQNSRQYYEAFLSELRGSDMGGLYFAWFESRVIAAGIFVLTTSRAIYYYGASSSEKEDRKQMAPYLLQWATIMEAKKRNIPLYDFLGVADPDDVHDSLRGVTDFKEKFGGEFIQLPEKMLFSLSWKYSLFKMIRSLLRR